MDDAAMKIIMEYKKVYGKKEAWKKCDKLYSEILNSIESKDISRNILQIKDID